MGLERTSKMTWSSGSQISLHIRIFCRAFKKCKIYGTGSNLQVRFFADRGAQELTLPSTPQTRPQEAQGLTLR